MLLGCETFCPSNELRLLRKYCTHSSRQMAKTLELILFSLQIKTSVKLGKRKCEQVKRDQLSSKSLGRSYTNLNPRTRDICQAAFVHHRRCCYIANRERLIHAEIIASMT